MNVFVLSAFCVACVLAAPHASGNDESVSKQQSISYPASKQPIVSILKQIHQVNDDGSYTFGYEAADGTFRVEKKDNVGYVVGKYGFYDENGKFQVLDYVAGKGEAGKTLGFQPKGDLIPAILKINPGSSSTPEQKALDLEYSSVDDDEDGFPDRAPGYQAAQTARVEYQKTVVQPIIHQQTPVFHKVAQPVVRLETPTYQTVSQPVVRVEANEYQKVGQQPVVRVETTEYQQKVAQPTTVRLETPTYQTVSQPVVRVKTTEYQQKAVQPVVRLVAPVAQQKTETNYVQLRQPIFRNPPTVKVQKKDYGNQDQVIQVQQPAVFVVSAPSSNEGVQEQADSISIDSPEFFGFRII